MKPAIACYQHLTQSPLAVASQDACDGGHSPAPVGGFDLELFSAGAREREVSRTARVLGFPPLGVEPSGAFEPLQRGEERSRVDLEDAARDLLDAAADAERVQ